MELSNSGSSSSVKFYPLDSYPFGSSYSEWIVKYYVWISSIPENRGHPIFDKTGEKCYHGQTNPDVFFLPGASKGDSITRKCTMPKDKALLVNLLFSLCDEKVDNMALPADQEECVEDGLRDTRIAFTVDDTRFDGNLLPDINNFKIGPVVFDVSYAENNYLLTRGDYTPGKQYRSVIGAYAIILNPLLIGKHEINYEVTSRGCTQEIPFHVRVKYNVEVI